MRRLKPLLAVCLALLLLGAQQAAFAHLIGHVGVSSATPAMAGDGDHGSAESLSHTCVTCVGLSALAAAAPLPEPPLVDLASALLPSAVVTIITPAGGSNGPYRARAPPVTL